VRACATHSFPLSPTLSPLLSPLLSCPRALRYSQLQDGALVGHCPDVEEEVEVEEAVGVQLRVPSASAGRRTNVVVNRARAGVRACGRVSVRINVLCFVAYTSFSTDTGTHSVPAHLGREGVEEPEMRIQLARVRFLCVKECEGGRAGGQE
jgi:hypothetical protein